MIETSVKAVESFMNHDVAALGHLADQIQRIESELRELRQEHEARRRRADIRGMERWVMFMCCGWVVAGALFVALMLEMKGG